MATLFVPIDRDPPLLRPNLCNLLPAVLQLPAGGGINQSSMTFNLRNKGGLRAISRVFSRQCLGIHRRHSYINVRRMQSWTIYFQLSLAGLT